jgi:hypothetical protein
LEVAWALLKVLAVAAQQRRGRQDLALLLIRAVVSQSFVPKPQRVDKSKLTLL